MKIDYSEEALTAIGDLCEEETLSENVRLCEDLIDKMIDGGFDNLSFTPLETVDYLHAVNLLRKMLNKIKEEIYERK